MDNLNKITQTEHDGSLGMKKVGLYGWDGSKAVMIKVDGNGQVIVDSTIFLKLDCSNSPLTPPDGTVDPLFQVKTTGTNQYGWDVGTLDLTGVGYGKYPTLTARSNGTLGDGMGIIEGSLVIGNGVAGAFGHGFVFLNDATLATQTLLAEWNWDGIGNNRITSADDFNIATLLTAKNFTVGNENTDPYITFDGANTINPTIKYKESTLSILPSMRVNLVHKGLWFEEHDVNSETGEKISLFGDRFDQDDAYSIGVEANAVFFKTPDAYTWYIHTNPSYINPQTGYMMRLLDTGLEVVGDYLGTSFSIGANTLDTNEWAFLDGQDQAVKTTDNVTHADITATGEMKGCRLLIPFSRGSVTADSYLAFGGNLCNDNYGAPLSRPGSIVSVAVDCWVSAQTTAGNVVFQVRKNASTVFTVTISINGTGYYRGYAVQARGVDTFTAGQYLNPAIDFTTFAGTLLASNMLVEICYDT